MDALVFMRSSSHREPPACQQLGDLRGRDEVEVSRHRVLEARGGQREFGVNPAHPFP